MKPELALEELPAPGEPLQPKIHQDNQKLIDEEIEERAIRVRAKLTRWQLFKLRQRYKQLSSKLIRAKWNQLCKQRWDLWQICEKLRHEIKTAKGKARANLKKQLAEIIPNGKKVDALINKLKPLADEFESVGNRLKAHREVIAWEREDRQNKEAFASEARAWREQMKAMCKQSPRLHHRWEDERGRWRCDIPDFNRIIVKDDRILYHIRVTSQNPLYKLLGRWKNHLPLGVDVTDLLSEETLANLSAATARVVTAERIGNNLFWCISRLDGADGIPTQYPYERILDYYPSEDHQKTPWAAGVTHERKIAWFSFGNNPHVLIAGTTQSGKSNQVNQMIALIATLNSPNEVRFVLIDNKGGVEFTHWRGLKHLLMPMIKTVSEVPRALKYVRSIMERRLAAFEAMDVKSLESYNARVKDQLPRVICVVDEMATLVNLGELTDEIHNELLIIASQGRAVGIHLILCTQHPSREVLPGWTKTNMGVRVSGRMPSHTGSMIILDTVTAASLPDIAGRLVFSTGKEIIAQSPFISDTSIARTVALSKEFPDPDNSEFENTAKSIVLIPKPKFGEEDAIEMALTLFNGQLSPTKMYKQIEKGIMSEKDMKDLVNEILERAAIDGSIEHKGKLYKPRKIRKYHILESVGTTKANSSDEETIETKDHLLPVEATA